MRILLAFIGIFILSLVIGAVISYPIYRLMTSWFEPEFERLANRIVLFSALFFVFLLVRNLGFKTWYAIGFESSMKEFWMNFAKGFGYGLLIMSPVTLGLLLTKNRTVDPDWYWAIDSILPLIMLAFISGFLVSLIEETLIRGAMIAAIKKQSTVAFTVITTSFIYAMTHFIKPEIEIAATDVTWASGFILLKNAFIPFFSPLTLLDSFIALFLAGTLLAIIRVQTNKLGLCIGIHAGWVFSIKVLKKMTDSNIHSEFAYLTGSYDKVVGYLAAVCILIAIVIFLRANKLKA